MDFGIEVASLYSDLVNCWIRKFYVDFFM